MKGSPYGSNGCSQLGLSLKLNTDGVEKFQAMQGKVVSLEITTGNGFAVFGTNIDHCTITEVELWGLF